MDDHSGCAAELMALGKRLRMRGCRPCWKGCESDAKETSESGRFQAWSMEHGAWSMELGADLTADRCPRRNARDATGSSGQVWESIEAKRHSAACTGRRC